MTRSSRSASPTCSSSKAPTPPALSGQPNSPKGSVGWACAVPAPTATQLTGRLGATPSLSSRPARPPLQSASSARCAARASCLVPLLRSSRGNTCVTVALTPRSGLRAPHPVPTTPQYPATVGRSRAASDSLYEMHLSDLTPASRALLLSQAG